MGDQLLSAVVHVFTLQTVAGILAGTFIGLIIGALPGLTATMGMALLSPLTYFLDPLVGIPFLIGLYKGGTYGGTISAVLIGTPGTASNAATVLDGYVMARRGEGGRALKASLNSALIGDVIGSLALIFGAPLVAKVALHFGPSEFFALTVFSLTMVCYVSGTSLAKGLLAATIGMLAALIGVDPIGGSQRLTFGVEPLKSGINVIALVIGAFALSEVLVQMERMTDKRAVARGLVELGHSTLRLAEMVPFLRNIIRSSLVGTLIGALPGIGAETSNWVAYGLAKRASKHPEEFGKGTLEGVVAPEAAANAVCGAAMVPMLTFGIPGDIVTAIMLGAFIAQGLIPGPFLIEKNPTLFYGLFMTVLMATVALWFLGSLTQRYFVRVLNTPAALLYPIIVVLCVGGTYAVNSSMFDVFVMLGFGVLGYGMRKLDVPIPPMVLAFILSKLIEDSLRRALVHANGNVLELVSRPTTAVILLLAVAVLGAIIWKSRTATH